VQKIITPNLKKKKKKLGNIVWSPTTIALISISTPFGYIISLTTLQIPPAPWSIMNADNWVADLQWEFNWGRGRKKKGFS
jgi:hypothetical protein